MKYKTLVIREGTKYQTFAVYEETIAEWCECDTPHLYPITANMDGLKKFYRNSDFTDITMVTIELKIINE